MLKFLTHKLRTHSLNEDNVCEKVEERDSGTESDDEAERADSGEFCTDVIMKWNGDATDISAEYRSARALCVCADNTARVELLPVSAPASVPTPDPDPLYDHHSSEEELEVINGAPTSTAATCDGIYTEGERLCSVTGRTAAESRRRGASSPPPTAPEKRKWLAEDPAHRPPSSDDDDIKVETPVRFRTSPPLEALKPRRTTSGSCLCLGSSAGTGTGGGVCTRSGAGSPRRRRTPLPPPRRHRPALDFDKMQQLRMSGSSVGGGVRSWRTVGGAGGELSVFCW